MAEREMLTLEIAEGGIAVLTINDPHKGVNVLSQAVLEELDKVLTNLEYRSDLTGLIIRSGKPGSFIAGADLREFVASLDAPKEHIAEMCRRGRGIFQRLSMCPFVTVAAIDGICVGGGAELAVWCDRRIMADDPRTQIGFPEVKLGLFPGWGGTARTSRIVGLSNAVELVTSGDPIDGRTAAAMGLVSDLTSADRIVDAAKRLIQAEQTSKQYLRDRERWSGPLEMNETELTFLGATASGYIQQQTKGHYPAPLAALEVMLEASMADIDAACEAEAQGMTQLFGSPVNRALINVFFLGDRNKKDRGVDADVQPQAIKSVAVIGAGIMGAGIAAANVKRKLPVALSDARAEALGRGVQQILEEVSYNKQLKAADPKRTLEFAPLLNATTSDAELASCDLIIEAVIENADAKRQLYARLEPQLNDEAILGSNTSTIPISRLAEGLRRPDRFCGIHFFNPVRKMPLVEIIRGRQTSDQTVATVVAYAKSIGKSPIVVGDGPGFLVNRLLFPYLNEALELIHEGAEIDAIERASKAFGMPLGPIALYDMVGLDTSFYAGRVMWEAFPDRTGASPILPVLIKAGRLGQKSGAGFFSYAKNKERGEKDPALAALIDPLIHDRKKKFTAEQLTHRLFLPMVLEATRILDEKLVRDVRDVDLGMIYGLGFPPFKGGLLFWADTIGAAKIVEMLKPYEELGERMKPTPLLLDLARSGRKFYDLRV